MLTPTFYQRHQSLPTPWLWSVIAAVGRAALRVAGLRVAVDGPLPSTPSLLCTNASHRHDFLLLMKALDQHGQRTVSVSKAKNFHSAWQAAVMRHTGTVPIASRGYLIAADFRAVFGRLPSDEEYRVLRDHVDGRSEGLPTSLGALTRGDREVVGVWFDAGRTWQQQIHVVYEQSMAHTVRLARRAIDAGYHVQIYPEGTVSSRMGVGRPGAVQLARALGVPLLPVGLSNAPDVFLGQTPLPAAGLAHVRFGAPIDHAGLLPPQHRPFTVVDERDNAAALQRATATLMTAIEALTDQAHKRPSGALLPHKGVSAFL